MTFITRHKRATKKKEVEIKEKQNAYGTSPYARSIEICDRTFKEKK